MRKHFFFLLLLTLISLYGIKALFHPGLYTAHDIWHQVSRLYHYYQAFNEGQFPPYWIGTLANGYGYPLFFFSYHLPWIIAIPFLNVGFDIPNTIKILFMVSYVLSGITMYALAYHVFKNKWAGLLTSILYLWSPYRFVNILVSAAMGTAWVFVFLPLTLLGIYKTTDNKNFKIGILLTAVGINGMFLSHIMTSISLIPVLFLFILWALFKTQPHKRTKYIKHVEIAFALGIGLSAFYLLPALYYSHLTQTASGAFDTLYQKHFVNLRQLIYSKWGYGIADTAKEMNVSFQIGISQWLSILTLAILLILNHLRINQFQLIEKVRGQRFLGIIILTIFFISVFMMVDASRPAWDLTNKFVILDYPTMFLFSATLAGSFAASWTFTHLDANWKILYFIFILFLAFYTNRNHLRVNAYTYIPVSLYIASETTTNSFHEYLPQTASLQLFSLPNNYIALPKTITVSNIFQNTNTLSFTVETLQSSLITIRQIAFPGLNLYIDNQKTNFTIDALGRIQVILPQGIHSILIKFNETALIKISKLATIISIGILLLLIKKSYEEKKS